RRGLTLQDVAKVEEWKLELPGVITEVEPQRVYPTGRFAAHLLGYVREASDDQLKQGRYRRGEMVGQSRLERLLDEYLRGQDGGERIEVDAMGRPVRLIQQSEPRSGAQVITTVDRRIQEAAEGAMEGHTGAVVVMDPRNGDLLAMVSTPAFDVDRFTESIDRSARLRLRRSDRDRAPGREVRPGAAALAPHLAPGRDGQPLDRPGRRAGHADAGRALHGRGGERWRALAPTDRAADRAARERRAVQRCRSGQRPRGALPGRVGVPAPEPVGGGERRHRRRGSPSRAPPRGEDRHRG